jgi:hypothetical protein
MPEDDLIVNRTAGVVQESGGALVGYATIKECEMCGSADIRVRKSLTDRNIRMTSAAAVAT